jgi:hypothetical protein
MLGQRILLLGLFAFSPLGVAAQSAGSGTAESPPASAAPTAPIEERVFDITRDGNKIGGETLTFQKDGDTTIVKFKTHVSVVVMFVEAYHYTHSAEETWTGGKFVSYKAVTDDNGKHYNLAALAKDEQILLNVNGTHSKLPGNLVFATLWSRDFVGQTNLLHPDSGVELAVKVQDLGDEQIDYQGEQVKAHHYAISGDYDRDVWFEGDKVIRIRFYGSDHSTIMSELVSDKTN